MHNFYFIKSWNDLSEFSNDFIGNWKYFWFHSEYFKLLFLNVEFDLFSWI